MAALLALLACGNPFRDTEDVAVWANTASAVAVYSRAYEPIAFADGEETFDDPACPATADDGVVVSITGGCTDAEGNAWSGEATITRAGDDRTVVFDQYGGDAELTGTFDLLSVGPSAYTFHADLDEEGGMTVVIDYDGEVTGDYHEPTRWSGSGLVSRDGPLAPTGEVEATTTDELLDDAICAGQAISGETSLVIGKHEAVITYDGGDDCDPDQAAKLAVDGEDQGLIAGISCSSSAGRPGLALGLLALALRRRGRLVRF
jgi:hypothetical protein